MIIGTAGHIDHGKTALVKALTGVETDRLKEEKARGISIDLGFAYMAAGVATLGFIDVPGHERFVHTMLAGAGGIDFALLVVAADDGVMPQTREHLAIIDLLGVSQGLVALTKADLVPPSRLEVVTEQVQVALAGTTLAEAEVMAVSSLTGAGIDDLRGRLVAAAGRFAERDGSGRFRLAVDRSFTLAGAGTVVTGTVLSGAVAVGDRVIVSPSGREARVRSIHAQNQAAAHGQAGQRCALNLAGEGMAKEAVGRGDVVLDPALHAPAERIDATLRILPGEPKAIGQWFPARLHHGAAEVGARVVLLGDEPVAPGATATVQLVLDRPIAAAVGDRYVLRDTSAQRTIGGGRFLDLRAPARKRRTAERQAQLEACPNLSPDGAATALLMVPPHTIDLTAFVRDRALGPGAAAGLVERLGLVTLPVGTSVLALSAAGWAGLRRDLAATLEAFHRDNPDLPGLGLERLRLLIARGLPAPAFKAALHVLAQAGEVALAGAWARLAGHEVRLTPADEQRWAAIAPLLSGAERFRPPRVRDLAGHLGVQEAEVRRLMKLLGRLGRVDEVAQDHFFRRATVAEMVDIAQDLAETAAGAPFTAAQFRDRLDNGRKVAIQILEFFDRHGVTLRRGDLRRLNKHRLDLFRPVTEAEPALETSGRASSPVGRPDFKSGRGREPVPGGFDSHSLPPSSPLSPRPARKIGP